MQLMKYSPLALLVAGPMTCQRPGRQRVEYGGGTGHRRRWLQRGAGQPVPHRDQCPPNYLAGELKAGKRQLTLPSAGRPGKVTFQPAAL